MPREPMTAPMSGLDRRDGSGALPIADYAMLSDCNSAALVGADGSVDWFCMPRYDSPALFSRLLDPDAGHWSIEPVQPYTVTRRYLPGTLILETTFTTQMGRLRLVDGLALAPGQRGHDLGLDAPHELLRLAQGISGTVELQVHLVPRPEYGLVEPLLRATEDGVRTFGGPNAFSLRAGVPVEVEESVMRARFSVESGGSVGFSLCWVPLDRPATVAAAPAAVADRLDDACAAWRSWENEHDVYDGPHRELVRSSARVLKGLTYRPTGAVVAAVTTSLPETPGGERNWDYRYAWIRDASLTLEALYIGACSDEAESFVSFMTSSAGGGYGLDRSLQIMYGVAGEHDLSERELGHLRGWRNSRPVRVGNGAWRQTQHDVYGELLGALHLYQGQLGDLHPEIQHFAARLADTAARRWREPDAGMWEMRGEAQHHLSSKVMCWVALDRAVRLAPDLGEFANAAEWSDERDAVRATVLERGWSELRGAYGQSFDSDRLDAAALLMPLVGFLPATDPRMRATIDAIASDLTDGGLVLRYRNDAGAGADGLTGEEGTFVICSFWLVACLAQAGERQRAQAVFDRVVSYANDVGLLAEEIETETGALLGNTPQAFSHVGLIIAANALDSVA